MLKEETFDAGGVGINYGEGPSSGPPLVLLHGGGDRWQSFSPILPSLMLHWQVFALDLRGHGKSARTPDKYRPQDYVPDVRAFLKEQVNGPAILFGHSLGGWIALLTVQEIQEKIRGLIIGDPPLNIKGFLAEEGSPNKRALWQSLYRLAQKDLSIAEMAARLAEVPIAIPNRDQPIRYADLPTVDALHLRSWASSIIDTDPGVIWYHAKGRLAEYVESANLDQALAQILCPVLLLQADPAHGGKISDGDADHAMSLLRDGLHVKLEGIGHDLGLEAWHVAPLLRAMTRFISSTS